MNNYEFGNLLYKLRMKSNLTQEELAKKLNITNKAISKWENGRAIPNTNTLKNLSILFNIPIDNLLQITKQRKKEIIKIVITGGPCAGKTTAMSWVQNAFTNLGYHVIFVPECATEIINAGISQ